MEHQVPPARGWPLILSLATACAHAQDLSEAQREAFRASRCATIVVEQSYGEAAGVNLPFGQLPRRLLEHAGLQVVPASCAADLTLRIVAKGKAEAATYRFLGNDRLLYTGASVEGTISAQAGSLPPVETRFAGKVEPPEKLQFEYPKGFTKPTGPTRPSAAPFRVAYESGSFEEELAKLVLRLYGARPLALAVLHDEPFNPARHKKIIALLKSVDDSAAVEVLTQGLRQKDPSARERAAGALQRLGDPRAVDALITAARDSNPDVRFAVVRALGATGDSRALPTLLAFLKGRDPEMRYVAAGALGGIRDPRSLEALLLAAKDRQMDIRIGATASLGRQGDPRALPAVLAAFRSPDEELSHTAARALPRLGAPGLGAISELLEDSDRNIRALAVVALSHCVPRGPAKPDCLDPGAVDLLITALRDQDDVVSNSAARWLATFAEWRTGKQTAKPSFGRDPVRWQQWWQRERPRHAQPSITR